jgi:hypothetical protein
VFPLLLIASYETLWYCRTLGTTTSRFYDRDNHFSDASMDFVWRPHINRNPWDHLFYNDDPGSELYIISIRYSLPSPFSPLTITIRPWPSGRRNFSVRHFQSSPILPTGLSHSDGPPCTPSNPPPRQSTVRYLILLVFLLNWRSWPFVWHGEFSPHRPYVDVALVLRPPVWLPGARSNGA